MQKTPENSFVSQPFLYTFGAHKPQIAIRSGSALRIDCADCDNRIHGGVLSVEQRHQPDGSRVFEANPVAGPIEIVNAEPGDCVAVEILKIDIPEGIGQTGIGPGHGLLPAHLVEPQGQVPRHLYQWQLDPLKGNASLLNRLGAQSIEVPLKPFVGCIGVSPEYAQSISTLYAGKHGGNMDLPSLGAGSTVYLPVFAKGGLVMIGDLHAAQGHAEAIGGAIETPGQVDVRFHLRKGKTIPAPRVRTPTEIGAVASDGDLRAAVQLSFSRLLSWMAEELLLNRFDAYALLSQTARVEIGNLVNSPYTVGTFIGTAALPLDARRLLEDPI